MVPERVKDSKGKIVLAEKNSEDKDVWPRKDRPKWLAVLFCATAALYSTRIAMPLCIVTISQEMNWNKEESGLVLSSFFWGYTAAQLPGGCLSDKYGGEVTLTLSAVGFALSTVAVPVLLTLIPTKTHIAPLILVVICRICLGVAQGLYYPSIASLLAKRVPVNDRSFAYSIGLSGGPVGSLLMGSLGSVMLTSLGWDRVFYFFGSLGLFWLLLWRGWFINSFHFSSQKEDKLKPLDNYSHAAEISVPVPWGEILKQPAIWAMVIVHFCHNCMYFILLSWMPTYFHEHFPQSKGWVYNVCPYAGNLVGKISGGYVADYLIREGYSIGFTRKLLEALGTAFPALIIVFVSSATEFWQALLCLTFCLTLNGLTTSASLVNPQDLAPQFAGSISGLQLATGAIPGILGVYVTGYILHVTGSWAAVFHSIAGACIFGTVVFVSFGKGEQIL